MQELYLKFLRFYVIIKIKKENFMKKFLSIFLTIFNIMSFLFISHVILDEFFLSTDGFPTLLSDKAYYLGNVAEYYIKPLWSIIFTYLSVVVLSFLIFIVLLFLRKVKSYFYILSTIYNLIIAIPIFNMYNNLFGIWDNNLNYITSPWMLYMFLSTFSATLLLVYTLFNKTRHLFKETTIRKIKKISLISISSFFAFYLINCVYLSFKIKNISEESYATYGEVNKFPDDISDLNFFRMKIRYSSYKDKTTYEEKWCSFPISLIIFNQARAWYWYEYKSNAYYARTDSHLPVVVDLEFKNFRWVITNVFDHP